jgi:hypothetical protein
MVAVLYPCPDCGRYTGGDVRGHDDDCQRYPLYGPRPFEPAPRCGATTRRGLVCSAPAPCVWHAPALHAVTKMQGQLTPALWEDLIALLYDADVEYGEEFEVMVTSLITLSEALETLRSVVIQQHGFTR